MFCMLLFNFVYYVLLLCMFRSRYCVSLRRSVYSLCVNVYCTTATGCQSNCSYKIYINYENSQVINRLIFDIHPEIDTKNDTYWCVL